MKHANKQLMQQIYLKQFTYHQIFEKFHSSDFLHRI